MKNMLVYGSKEYAFIIRDLIDYLKCPFTGFIDDFSTGPDIVGNYQYVKAHYNSDDTQIVIAVGYDNLSARWNVYQKVKMDYRVITLIHNNAYIRNKSNIGTGSVIMSNVTIDSNAKVGEMVVAWPGVVINHDTSIGDNTFLSPNSTICGSVKIGRNCFIGAGAIITDHIEVADNSFIKAGQVYSKSASY